MMEPVFPKYSLAEIERRWLVDSALLPALESLPHREIDDHYLHDTWLRLRAIRQVGQATEYKLCKKYGKTEGIVEPVTNLYLSAAEYAVLAKLPAARIGKTRYALAGGSLDLYRLDKASLAIFEIEFESEDAALTYSPPDFVAREVTNNALFTGYAFAQSAS